MQSVINYYLNTQNLLSYTLYIFGAIILISVLAFIIDKFFLSKNTKTQNQSEELIQEEIEDVACDESLAQEEINDNIEPCQEQLKEVNKPNDIAKFIIKKSELQYFATLSFCGEEIYSTDHYVSLSGVKSMIDSFVKSISQNNFALTIDTDKKYAYKLYFSQTKEPFISQPFSSLKECKEQIELLKSISKNYIIENDF